MPAVLVAIWLRTLTRLSEPPCYRTRDIQKFQYIELLEMNAVSDPSVKRHGGMTATLGLLTIAVCCGAPALLAAIATTGIGTALAASGWSAIGLAIAVVGPAGGGWWWLRRRSVKDCATTSQGVTHDG